jgi:hypothetical protein
MNPALVDIRDTVAALKKAGRTLDELLQQCGRPLPTQSGASFPSIRLFLPNLCPSASEADFPHRSSQ